MYGSCREPNLHCRDLCEYLRTVLLAVPFVAALQILVVGGTVWAVAVYPIHLFGVLAYLGGLLVLLVIGALGWLCWAGIQALRRGAKAAFGDAEEVEQAPRKAGLWTLIREYVRSAHARICPVVHIKP